MYPALFLFCLRFGRDLHMGGVSLPIVTRIPAVDFSIPFWTAAPKGGMCYRIGRFCCIRMYRSGVLIYKTVSDCLETREQPKKRKFMGQTTFFKSKFNYLPLFQGQ